MKRLINSTIFIGLVIIFICVVLRCTYTAKRSKWEYIVIHHSGTTIGNTKRFDKYHRKVRHMKNGIAYHFVICNGSCGCEDGYIEITSRWEKQLSGGHCHCERNNDVGIGICLVGNFQKTKPTEDQYWSLVWLVKKLMKEQNIKAKNVLGHKDMKGETTLCPGKYFPWKRLKKDIS